MKLPDPSKEVVPPLEKIKAENKLDLLRALMQFDINDARYVPVKGYTYCNRLVHDVAYVLDHPMPRRPDGWPMLANDMIEWMSDNWRTVEWKLAISRADRGRLVVFGWKNPDGHGHVGIIRPSMMEITKPSQIPTMQAGFRNWDANPLGLAFSYSILPEVKYFSPHIED
jgi:hypothetical protein